VIVGNPGSLGENVQVACDFDASAVAIDGIHQVGAEGPNLTGCCPDARPEVQDGLLSEKDASWQASWFGWKRVRELELVSTGEGADGRGKITSDAGRGRVRQDAN
jgi:hypothetical protein